MGGSAVAIVDREPTFSRPGKRPLSSLTFFSTCPAFFPSYLLLLPAPRGDPISLFHSNLTVSQKTLAINMGDEPYNKPSKNTTTYFFACPAVVKMLSIFRYYILHTRCQVCPGNMKKYDELEQKRFRQTL